MRVALAIAVVVLVIGVVEYFLGRPANAAAASCTQARPCTKKQAERLELLGRPAQVADSMSTRVVGNPNLISTHPVCRSVTNHRSIRNGLGTELMWATMVKLWCHRRGFVTFAPPPKVTSDVTGFARRIGFGDLNTIGSLDQRYPWRGDPRRGTWSWRQFATNQTLTVVRIGLLHIQRRKFAISTRGHGDGTFTKFPGPDS